MAKDNPSIDDRIDRINQAVDLYSELIGDEDERSLTIDILTDIMHMAHDQGWKLKDLLTVAEVNFNEEQAEEEDEDGEEEEEEYDGEEDDDNEEEEE